MSNNRQSAANTLTNSQLQVLITGKFGDGHFSKVKSTVNYLYQTNSIDKEFLEYKQYLLGDLCKSDIKEAVNLGYKKSTIYRFHTKVSPKITELAILPPMNLLEYMDELGLALWIYDDGSLHKENLSYNINTQAYSKEENIKISEILYRKFSIIAVPTIERKKDGREFWYLRVRKYEGSFYISEIMRKHLPSYLHRKCISSETIQRWSKFQEELKSKGIDKELSSFKKNSVLINAIEKGELSIQDIVRTYVKA